MHCEFKMAIPIKGEKKKNKPVNEIDVKID